MRDLTDKPFGVNIAQVFVRDPRIVDFVHDQGVRFVTTSAGDPARYTAALHDAGITVFHVVPNLHAAMKAIAAGVDGIVAEGGEGGGFKSTRDVASMVLVPLVCSSVDVPVIAAGGICDGRTMAAAFALGAEGVQMGTRMVSAAESPVHDNYKQLIVDAAETGTVFLNRFHKPSFRVLATPYSEAREQSDEQVPMASLEGLLDALLRRRPRRRVRVRRPGRGPHRRGEAGRARSSTRPSPSSTRPCSRSRSTVRSERAAARARRAAGARGVRGGRGRVRGEAAARPGRRRGEAGALGGRRPAAPMVGGDARHADRADRRAVRVPQRRQGEHDRHRRDARRRAHGVGRRDPGRRRDRRADRRPAPARHQRRGHRAVRRRRSARRHARHPSSRCRRGAG